MVQFQDLLLRAPEGLYNICFAAVSSLVSPVPLVGHAHTSPALLLKPHVYCPNVGAESCKQTNKVKCR